jgi:hypothetical protein
MVDKEKALRAALKTAAEKGAASRERKRAKRLTSASGSAGELHIEWSTAYRRKFGTAPVPWGPAEKSLAKKLVTEHGFDRSVDIVRRFFSSWDELPNRTNAPPILKVMWYRVADIVADLDGVKPIRARQAWSGMDAEYRDDGSPSEGWGDEQRAVVARPDEEW